MHAIPNNAHNTPSGVHELHYIKFFFQWNFEITSIILNIFYFIGNIYSIYPVCSKGLGTVIRPSREVIGGAYFCRQTEGGVALVSTSNHFWNLRLPEKNECMHCSHYVIMLWAMFSVSVDVISRLTEAHAKESNMLNIKYVWIKSNQSVN